MTRFYITTIILQLLLLIFIIDMYEDTITDLEHKLDTTYEDFALYQESSIYWQEKYNLKDCK